VGILQWPPPQGWGILKWPQVGDFEVAIREVNFETKVVTFDEMCEIPMVHIGCYDQGHEFKCGASAGECFYSSTCPQFRVIPLDNGHFQRILSSSDQADQALDIRKNLERPFNLLKNREGLEQVRVRSQHALLARSTFSTIATLMLEMAGTRKKKKPKKRQMELFDKAA